MEEKTEPARLPEVPARKAVLSVEQADAAKSGVLRLFAEDAAVSRQTVETGRVRVTKTTHTREHLVDELLKQTKVEVETIPIGRFVDAIPAVREDGDLMIIPIVEETLVVERRLLLKEELHIRRLHTTERYQETVQLRHQTADVTRLPPQQPTTESVAEVDSIPKT